LEIKTSVSQTLDVIDREFDEDLTGDKYVNVLKAKDKLRKMLFDFKTHTGIRG
jgi:hypothetical protein